MTTADLVALVAGVALGFAAIARIPWMSFFPPAWVLIVQAVDHFFLAMAMALSVVALGRAARYRRMPRAAEWLAIVVSASGLASWPEFNVDGWVNVLFATFPGSAELFGFDAWRWVVAGLAGLAILASLGLTRLGRRDLPSWLKTLFLSWAALLALAGPLWAFGFLGDDLVSPPGGFGAGDLAIFHREACLLFGYFPSGVFFGVPTVATLVGRLSGRRWTWVEWTAVSTSTMVGVTTLMLWRGEFDRPSLPWAVERCLAMAWFLAVAMTSRLLITKLGPAWRRWFDEPADRDQPSSGADSAANILST